VELRKTVGGRIFIKGIPLNKPPLPPKMNPIAP